MSFKACFCLDSSRSRRRRSSAYLDFSRHLLAARRFFSRLRSCCFARAKACVDIFVVLVMAMPHRLLALIPPLLGCDCIEMGDRIEQALLALLIRLFECGSCYVSDP
jgi:hypothetical protein